MGLIRLIILGVVVWLCLRMVRQFQAAQLRKSASRKKIDQSNMVPCAFCNVHLPENQAVPHGDLWFCSDAHKNKYLAENP